MNRRTFLKTSALSGTTLLVQESLAQAAASSSPPSLPPLPAGTAAASQKPLPKFDSARWLWYPSERCLQNTFVLFRTTLDLPKPPRKALGWISADSRYRLEVNGQRVQWGPAPCDPRWLEADPMDLTPFLTRGNNGIGATVLFYGQGDGTWPMGKPGFLFWLEVELEDGQKLNLSSDGRWLSYLARSWSPGHYKRWFLRALQEEFDARLYPYGWSRPDFAPKEDWRPAMVLDCPSDKPPVCSSYPDYQFDISGNVRDAQLRARQIPLMSETWIAVKQLAESCWLEWRRPPLEYFECRTPEAFQVIREPVVSSQGNNEWKMSLDGKRGALLTFEFEQQTVGWPGFEIEAPEGTTIELLVQEAHQVGGPALMNTHFDSWTRFICREGINRFETFDFECCRWLQLHIHGSAGNVVVRDVGLRRRRFPWPHLPHLRCNEPGLQRLFEASINTVHNSALETCVDGMGRERQQYSGDGGHQLHAIHYVFGEKTLPARFVTTFSQGLMLDGMFLDSWPAYDRLARTMERQLGLTGWGPILDHSVGFVFDCWHYYLYTGDLETLREPYPRLLRFARYLRDHLQPNGLLPVEELGLPSVWMDHQAYQKQRHKQCAFNLYASAMLQHALTPLCQAFGDISWRDEMRRFGRSLQRAVIRRFWSPQHATFINNRPWLGEEKKMRMCDRSLATALLFDQCPGGENAAVTRALVECPPEMGFSYPANAGWRLWALGKAGRPDIILNDLRSRWATMDSVRLNNTIQEDWKALPDSHSQWSHCAVAPLYVAYMTLAGIIPSTPGFQTYSVRPQPGDLSHLELSTPTAAGAIGFRTIKADNRREWQLTTPPQGQGELIVPQDHIVNLPPAVQRTAGSLRHYQLPRGKTITWQSAT